MARKGYITPDNTARRVRQIYIGDETGKARRLKKVYLGVDDRAKLIMETRRYTITFNANGGSGSMNSIYCDKILESGEYVDFTAPASGFTRSGWQFLRWNTMPDGSGTTFRTDDTISINRDITLYAQWIELVTITWFKTAKLNWAGATDRGSLNNDTGPDDEGHLQLRLSFPQDSTASRSSLNWPSGYQYFTEDPGRQTKTYIGIEVTQNDVTASVAEQSIQVPKGTVINIKLVNNYANGSHRCAIYSGENSPSLLAGPSSPVTYNYTVNSNVTVKATWKTAGEYVPVLTELGDWILGWIPGVSLTDNRDSWWDLYIY